MFTHLNRLNVKFHVQVHSPQIFKSKVLHHGNTKQTHATISVTATEADDGIRFCISMNQAQGDSTS
jgi:hypothetical protein